MNYLVEIFCRYYKVPLNPKKVYNTIYSIDTDFIDFWNLIISEKDKAIKTKFIKDMVVYILNKMELTLDEEWEIIS